MEGLEVIVIVITFGASSGRLGLASLSAAVTAAAVGLVGLIVVKPLTRVPENALKMGVGLTEKHQQEAILAIMARVSAENTPTQPL